MTLGRRHLDRLLRGLVFVILGVMLLEGSALLTYRIIFGQPFSTASIERIKRRETLAALATPLPGQDPGQSSGQLLHPYLGFVPARGLGQAATSPCAIGSRGFYGELELHKKQDKNLIIAFLGGSTAETLFCDRGNRIASELRRLPGFAGRQATFVPLFAAGYKQPQSLLALSFYLLEGGQLDLAISFDGADDLVLSSKLSFLDIQPNYPISWNSLVSDIRSDTDVDAFYQVMASRELKQWTGALHDRLSFSALAGLGLALLYQHADATLHLARARLVERPGPQDPMRVSLRGPPTMGADPVPGAVALWTEAVRQAEALSRSHGFMFYAFLEPIPARDARPDADQTPLSSKISQEQDGPDPVAAGYPLLRQALANLRSSGTCAVDLSLALTDGGEDPGVDARGRYTERGLDRLAAAIVATVGQCHPARDANFP